MQHEIKQFFLRERLIELFHKDTIDSYRVRIHNTNSLLKELKQLLLGWEQKRVQRFETVRYSAEELCSSIKNDQYFDTNHYGGKDILTDELNTLIKSDGKNIDIYHFVYLLDRLREINSTNYSQRLFQEIDSLVFSREEFEESQFMPVMHSINQLCCLLSTELINIGYSKTYLFHVLKKITKSPPAEFESQFKLFKEMILKRNQIHFVVVFKLTSKVDLFNISFITELTDKIPEKYLHHKVKRQYSSFIASDKYSKFVYFDLQALDQFSAIKKSKILLSELFDRIHLGYNGFETTVHSQALVVNLSEKSLAKLNSTVYMFDGIFESNETLYLKFGQLIVNISENVNIAQDVKDRLYSALRYLRMGSIAIEIEQRFIDYWIGLEFIFSSPQKGQTTYTRLKDNMVNVLSNCYLKRNFYVLNQELVKAKYLDADKCFWLLKVDEFDELNKKIDSPLLSYQLQKKKALIFESSEKRKSYVSNHVNNLNQNISRIYHLRNELIHEAALKQDIESITSNLRYYLVFVLNQIISFFSKLPSDDTDEKSFFTLDDMFSEHKMIRKQIEKEWKLHALLSVPVEMDLISR